MLSAEKRAEMIAKSCTSKVRYEKEWQARREAKRSSMAAYKCRHCGGYHCGH